MTCLPFRSTSASRSARRSRNAASPRISSQARSTHSPIGEISKALTPIKESGPLTLKPHEALLHPFAERGDSRTSNCKVHPAVQIAEIVRNLQQEGLPCVYR